MKAVIMMTKRYRHSIHFHFKNKVCISDIASPRLQPYISWPGKIATIILREKKPCVASRTSHALMPIMATHPFPLWRKYLSLLISTDREATVRNSLYVTTMLWFFPPKYHSTWLNKIECSVVSVRPQWFNISRRSRCRNVITVYLD